MSEANFYEAPTTPIGPTEIPGQMRSGRGIYGTDDLSDEDLTRELEAGGRFVVFDYCVSALVVTYRGSSKSIYFVRKGEFAAIKGLPWTLLTLVAGWWGFPSGLILTPFTLAHNLVGGTDVTHHVVTNLLRWGEAQAVKEFLNDGLTASVADPPARRVTAPDPAHDVPDVLKQLRL